MSAHAADLPIMSVTRVHVAVVGGGLAGLCAALTASDAGARVTLLLGSSKPNSTRASSGINACCSTAQAAVGVLDSRSAFFRDTMDSGGGAADATLVRALVACSSEVPAWLEAASARRPAPAPRLHLSRVVLLGGHSCARTHQEPPPVDGRPGAPIGKALVDALRGALEGAVERGAVTVLAGARATRLLLAPDGDAPAEGSARHSRVVGVVYRVGADGEEVEVRSDAVVLASGGYTANKALLAAHAPQCLALPHTGSDGCQGDALALGAAAGAATRDLGLVQVHPTALVPWAWVDRVSSTGDGAASTGDGATSDGASRELLLAPEALRGVGGVLLSARGARFCDELGRRDAVTDALTRACGGSTAFLVLTLAAAAKLEPAFSFFYVRLGFFVRVDGAGGLSRAIRGVPSAGPPSAADGAAADAACASLESAITKELASYAASARGDTLDVHGKRVFPDGFSEWAAGSSVAAPALWCARVTPANHYSMGGLCVNAAAEVLAHDLSVSAADCASLLGPGESSCHQPPVGAADAPLAAHSGPRPPTPAAHGDALPATASSPCTGLVARALLRPIRGLYAAGECVGGVHGANRLGGSSLLACVVFGRAAGARAAAAQPPGAPDAPALRSDEWTPLTLRETWRVTPRGVMLFRFSLPSPDQKSGVPAGAVVALRFPGGAAGGEERFYSPVSRPDARGYMDLLIRIGPGEMAQALDALAPGETVEVRGPAGGPVLDFSPGGLLGAPGVTRLAIVVGGCAVGPALQAVRTALVARRFGVPLTIVCGASALEELPFHGALTALAAQHPQWLTLRCTVDALPATATAGVAVGLIDEALLHSALGAGVSDPGLFTSALVWGVLLHAPFSRAVARKLTSPPLLPPTQSSLGHRTWCSLCATRSRASARSPSASPRTTERRVTSSY